MRRNGTGHRVAAALALWLVLAPLCSTSSHGAAVGDVTMADSVVVGGQSLMLNGAGLRIKTLFKIYAAGLYLPEKAATPDAVLAQKSAKRISMMMLRDVTSKQLIDALMEGIRDNHTAAETEALKPRAERLGAIMAAIGAAKNGNIITLDYAPDAGTRVTLNGNPLGDAIAGDDFYRALLKIWLGNDPVDQSLKKALLGQGSP